MKLRYLFLIIILNFFSTFSIGQDNYDFARKQFESLQENNPDIEFTDDSYLQDLEKYSRHPINLNKATFSQLASLRILSFLQITNFFSYKRLLGILVDIHELQSIPDWNLFTIQQILPFVYVGEENQKGIDFSKLFQLPEQKILIRYTQVLQKANGYLPGPNNIESKYLGSPAKILFRYNVSFQNFLQYGISASKDAGEQFFRGSQKSGFDFYSPHLFIKSFGSIRSLAIGDFTVNMGQGLIQWQGFSTGISSQVINIEKQSEVLHPYRSAGQLNFYRGIGITIGKKYLSKTFFVSQRKLDATFKTDSSGNDFISSLQSSGFHRTRTEIKNSNQQRQLTFGGNFTYSKNQFLVGINQIFYFFGTPIRKSSALFNKYLFSGKYLSNTSGNFSTTIYGIHSFGEIAIDNDYHPAIVSGLMVALDNKFDISFLYRNISRSYHSLYSNAFTESSNPVNEKGFYAGLSFNINKNLNFNFYADIFNFPWIKYRINSPSHGSDYLLHGDYITRKTFKSGFKFRYKSKPENYNHDSLSISPVVQMAKMYCKTYFDFKPTSSIFTYSISVILNSYRPHQGNFESGSLLIAQLAYSTPNKKFDIDGGFTFFSIPSSNTRIYSYENDILFNTSIPSFSGTGNRIFANVSYSSKNSYQLFFKISNFHYNDLPIVNSPDQIHSKDKTEIKFQILSTF